MDSFLVGDLQQAHQGAELAYRALIPSPQQMPRGAGTPHGYLETVRDEMQRRFNAAGRDGETAQIAVLKNAAAVYRAIGELDVAHWNALGATERRAAAGHFGDGDWRDREIAAVNAALASHPILAAYEAERLRLDAERAAAQVQRERERTDQAEREAPAALLAALRGRGFDLGLSPDCKGITLPPEHLAALEPHEAAEIKSRKASILELLKAEAAARRRVVFA